MAGRDEAIAAGFHSGECAYCFGDVWNDEGPVVEAGRHVFHPECAQAMADALADVGVRA